MNPKLFGIVFAVLVVAWLVGGLAWLLPRKLALLKRVGMKATNADLIRLAKEGDMEAELLRRDSLRYICVGVIVFVPLVLLKSLVLR